MGLQKLIVTKYSQWSQWTSKVTVSPFPKASCCFFSMRFPCQNDPFLIPRGDFVAPALAVWATKGPVTRVTLGGLPSPAYLEAWHGLFFNVFHVFFFGVGTQKHRTNHQIPLYKSLEMNRVCLWVVLYSILQTLQGPDYSHWFLDKMDSSFQVNETSTLQRTLAFPQLAAYSDPLGPPLEAQIYLTFRKFDVLFDLTTEVGIRKWCQLNDNIFLVRPVKVKSVKPSQWALCPATPDLLLLCVMWWTMPKYAKHEYCRHVVYCFMPLDSIPNVIQMHLASSSSRPFTTTFATTFPTILVSCERLAANMEIARGKIRCFCPFPPLPPCQFQSHAWHIQFDSVRKSNEPMCSLLQNNVHSSSVMKCCWVAGLTVPLVFTSQAPIITICTNVSCIYTFWIILMQDSQGEAVGSWRCSLAQRYKDKLKGDQIGSMLRPSLWRHWS